MRRTASRPPMPGMTRSISTTSGFRARVCLTASSPVAASPTTRRLASLSSNACRPARTTQWSSASRMWIGFGAGADAGRRDRLTGLHIRPTGRGRLVPSSFSIVAGNTQTDTIGAHLAAPLGVRVLTATGAGVPDVTVRFTASGNGAVVPTLATTDATGVAYANWTLRTLSGPDTVIATVAVLPSQQAVFTATVQPGRLAHLTITPDTVRFFKLQDTTAMQAHGQDCAHNAVLLGRLTWSIAALTSIIPYIDTAGVVRSLGPGSTAASATHSSSGLVATARVIVSQTPATVVVTTS